MSNISITDFPDEILEKIFLYLDFWDENITDLTEVCKKFNHVISSSSKLMNYLSITWKGKKLKDTRVLLASQRKYRRISIVKVYELKTRLLTFINNHQSTITDINFYKCAFRTSEFGSLLKVVCQNLQTISLCDVNFVNDEDAMPLDFRKLQWIELMYGGGDSYSVICKFFEGAESVTDFSYECLHELTDNEAQPFRELVASLKGLKKIQIDHILGQHLFANDFLARFSKFKLEDFYIWMNCPEHREYPVAKHHHYSNFIKFIESQRDTIKALNLIRFRVNADIVEFMFGLENLHTLYFGECVLRIRRRISVQNKSIQKLWLSLRTNFMDLLFDLEDTEIENSICDIIRNCPNLSNLHLGDVQISFEISMTINDYLTELKTLSFRNCDAPPITYPKVETIKLSRIDEDDAIKLIRVNKQLKHTELPTNVRNHRKYQVAMNELNLQSVEFSFF